MRIAWDTIPYKLSINNHYDLRLLLLFSDANSQNWITLKRIFVLKTCICKVLVYKVVGTLNFHFLIQYCFECGASFKMSQIGVNA